MEFHLTGNWWTRRFQNVDTTTKSNVVKISLKTTAFLFVRKFWTVVIGARFFAATHAQPNLVITKLNSKAFVYLAAMVWGENVVCVTLVSKISLVLVFHVKQNYFCFQIKMLSKLRSWRLKNVLPCVKSNWLVITAALRVVMNAWPTGSIPSAFNAAKKHWFAVTSTFT